MWARAPATNDTLPSCAKQWLRQSSVMTWCAACGPPFQRITSEVARRAG
jgi:hypothetical protein